MTCEFLKKSHASSMELKLLKLTVDAEDQSDWTEGWFEAKFRVGCQYSEEILVINIGIFLCNLQLCTVLFYKPNNKYFYHWKSWPWMFKGLWWNVIWCSTLHPHGVHSSSCEFLLPVTSRCNPSGERSLKYYKTIIDFHRLQHNNTCRW